MFVMSGSSGVFSTGRCNFSANPDSSPEQVCNSGRRPLDNKCRPIVTPYFRLCPSVSFDSHFLALILNLRNI